MNSPLKIGIFLGYWPWFRPEEQSALAILADREGIDSVWISEAWGHDAVSTLGWLAAQTEQVKLGSALLQIPARRATATAMAAATLDVLSKGRFRLGLGVSGPQVSEGWYGVPFGRPLGRTREYVEIVRSVLAGTPIQLELEDTGEKSFGIGKPLKLLARPVQERIPIYLGAIGPKSIRQCGAIADGWLPFLFNAAEPDLLLHELREGAAAAQRSIDEIDVAPIVPCAINADLAEARREVRPWLAFYLGAMGAKEKNFYVDLAERYGHGVTARRCQELMLAGDRSGAEESLTDELIDCACVVTTPQGLHARLAEYERAGVTTLARSHAATRKRWSEPWRWQRADAQWA
jgi:F420-dependent oxidoreductase-like protein